MWDLPWKAFSAQNFAETRCICQRPFLFVLFANDSLLPLLLPGTSAASNARKAWAPWNKYSKVWGFAIFCCMSCAASSSRICWLSGVLLQLHYEILEWFCAVLFVSVHDLLWWYSSEDVGVCLSFPQLTLSSTGNQTDSGPDCWNCCATQKCQGAKGYDGLFNKVTYTNCRPLEKVEKSGKWEGQKGGKWIIEGAGVWARHLG